MSIIEKAIEEIGGFDEITSVDIEWLRTLFTNSSGFISAAVSESIKRNISIRPRSLAYLLNCFTIIFKND